MKQFKIHFSKNRRIYYGISIGVILLGIICNCIFGAQLDIEFRGGTQLKYSYTDTSGAAQQAAVEKVVKDTVKQDASVLLNKNVKDSSGTGTTNNITIELAGTKAISVEMQQQIAKNLQSKFTNSKFALVESSSINPSMGQKFFVKCLVAVAITMALLLLYITIRFKKIGGTSAGVMAIIALLHDVCMVYFTFIFFQMPINGNFIAVVLLILGYSLNDTIIVYDRIRENRSEMPAKTPIGELVDLSINQTLTRSIFTALCTVMVIACLCVVAAYYQLASVTTLALPMMIGVISGCYSSVCIAGPLYVGWNEHKDKKRKKENAAKAQAAKAEE
ncbi:MULTISPECIES: protein translocase subunit SecF [Caproicibacterium]|jgi:preprotein translocase subunit SecF|uniref:Protein-export membrane protein SecF n=1 Tax=Caproicibacterium lactatifermentans TaxID=2666138 RepID=A0A859DUB7_9FIRM|nr:protein translocase subunit SecF [Caproicibacterium lactatifermentans]MDD4807422.1 protein translocase subunit SecF [Oscillospiraceae bacterium]QKN23611.1 protein translocase subunit SecF [Caproicibacterium lactatifermentans]QKO29713.1 protein translocase subunit SecF [Caproicibacterium lactatifermentans]